MNTLPIVLTKVNKKTFVNSRSLHEYWKVKEPYTTWIKTKLEELSLYYTEGQVKINKNYRKEYNLTLLSASALSIDMKDEKAQKYFESLAAQNSTINVHIIPEIPAAIPSLTNIELIVVKKDGKTFVSARKLYQWLQVSDNFSNWIYKKIHTCFNKNVDYYVDKSCGMKDRLLTLYAAQKICESRTTFKYKERYETARKYIACILATETKQEKTNRSLKRIKSMPTPQNTVQVAIYA